MRWNILSKRKAVLNHKKYPKILLEVFQNRGIKSEEEAERFLNPNYENDQYNSSLLPDIKEFLDRIYLARKNNEKIVIWGDFDVDGIVSTVLLHEILEKIGLAVDYYLPHRIDEGYGLNKKALLKISKKASLVITVDCGIRDLETISYGRKLGVDIIITDHHEPAKELPKSCVIVNPKVSHSKYPEKNLAAGGVVFKIGKAILEDERFKDYFIKGEEKWFLDLVALATIADAVPLLGENRVLTKYGLIVLGKTKRPGLSGLIDVAGIDKRKINSETVSFYISPRINVAGRLSHADDAFHLLKSSSYKNALSLARNLDKMNLERKRLTEAALKEAFSQIGEADEATKILFANSPDWHRGIVGIIAGRMADNFLRPAFAIEKGKKKSFGSARSAGDFNVVSLLEKCADLLIRFGGHKNAAGFSLLSKNIDVFKERLLKETALLDFGNFEENISVDGEIFGDEINYELTSFLEKLEPFGEGNSEPIFLGRNFKVIDKKLVGASQNHLSLVVRALSAKKPVFKAIGFKMGGREKEIALDSKIDLVFKIRLNEFRGAKNIDLIMLDFKKV